MNTRNALFRTLFVVGLASSFGLPAVAEEVERKAPASERAAIPATPAGVEGVIYARSFTLDEPVRYAWAADVETITEGTILVLEVDRRYLYHRAVAEPVLYVGERSAWRLSHDTELGRVVAVVPGEVDLETTPIFFGSPALPEQVDAKQGAVELSRAVASGVRAATDDDARRARDAGGPTLELRDRLDLLSATYDLIERYVLP